MSRLLCAVVCCLATVTSAAEWKDSFPPAAVASYFEGSKRTVLVVAAGEPIADARLAAQALELALRTSGKAALVMSGAGLKISPADDDAQIVKAAAAQPVELIAVVRVFEGSNSGPQNSVITLYDKGGSAQLAFTAMNGRPLAFHSGSGVDVGLSKGGGVATASAQQPRPERAYEQKNIWFEPGIPAGANFQSANQGRFGNELEAVDFYEVVGRTDLVGEYRARRRLKTAVKVAGSLTLAAGGLMAASDMFNPCVKAEGSRWGNCLQHSRPSMFAPGLVVAGVGLAGLIVGIVIPDHHITQGQAQKIADDYNAKFKSELEATPPAPKLRLNLAPVISANGAGLVMDGAF